MRRLFSVLKRGALSRTFVWKLRIAVNFFTPIAEALTASKMIGAELHFTAVRRTAKRCGHHADNRAE
jgi:hypothetical protein